MTAADGPTLEPLPRPTRLYLIPTRRGDGTIRARSYGEAEETWDTQFELGCLRDRRIGPARLLEVHD